MDQFVVCTPCFLEQYLLFLIEEYIQLIKTINHIQTWFDQYVICWWRGMKLFLSNQIMTYHKVHPLITVKW
jgi:hypothetical protein